MAIDIGADNFELLPYSMEAEQSILGGILIDPDSVNVVMDLVKPDYFYRDIHRQIFNVISDMYLSGIAIDYVTVLSGLENSGKLDGFSPEQSAKLYLARIMEMVPSAANIEGYCKIVADKYYLRRLIIASREISEAASGGNDAQLVLEMAEQKIFEIRGGTQRGGLVKIDKVIASAYDKLSKLQKEGGDQEFISTGFSHLDTIINGLNPSDLILIAARPAMGKTSFALNMAVNAARHSPKAVAVFSLEMSKDQLVERLLSNESKINSSKFRSGDISPEEWGPLGKAAGDLCAMNIYIDDSAATTVSDMKSKLRRVNNLGLVIIDYLQLMSSGKRIDNRVQEVSEMTRNLKIMAKELNVPVITLSQLSRESEKRKDHRPMLSDLRESGSIEQDADIVMFLYRDIVYNPQTADPGAAECIIGKNRHGSIGTINLKWDGNHTAFTSLETRYDDDRNTAIPG